MLERTTSASRFDQRIDAVHTLHRDYETRGPLPLSKIGVHRYAVGARTEIRCCAFAVDNEPVKLWTPGDAVPAEFREAAANPDWLAVAHNVAFEMTIDELLLAPR